MGAAVGISVFLVITTFLLHYAVFRWLSGGMSNFAIAADPDHLAADALCPYR